MSSTPLSDARITLLFEKFAAFVEGYASNLSMGGMFLETDDLRPIGSIVDFQIKLVDGFQLVQGLGEVVWICPRDTGTEGGSAHPAGLAVRFQSLDERGRELILKIMEERVRSGGEPFDLEAVPAGALTSDRGAAVASAEAAAVKTAETPSPRSEMATGESKILDEDGFTLLDADDRGRSTQVGRAFEELEFDAPWGEQLPELPTEVLEEAPDDEVTRPEPGSPASEAAFDGSFSLAEEAAAEVQLAPPEGTLGDPHFEDIDFSVASNGEALPAPPVTEPAVGTDSVGACAAAFDLVAEDIFPPPSEAFEEEEDATLAGERRAPTVSTSGEPTLPASEPSTVGAAAVEETPTDDWALIGASVAPRVGSDAEPVARPAPVTEPFKVPPESLLPPTAGATSTSAGDARAPRPPAAPQPASVLQDYEDDLFEDVAGASTADVMRQAFAGSGRTIALASLVLALAAAAFFYRDATLDLLGLGAPTEMAIAQADRSGEPSAEQTPPPPVAEPGSETVPALREAVEVEESPPPVIEVAAPPFEPVAAPGPAGPVAVPPSAELAAAPPAEPSQAPPTASPATRVDRISWRRADGGTLVLVELDGELAEDRYSHGSLTYDPTREMVEIRGIGEPYVSGRIEVGSPEIRQIRVGHHVKPGGNALRIVFDFPAAGPKVAAVRSSGDRLEILVLP